MRHTYFKSIVLLTIGILLHLNAVATLQTATVRVNKSTTYQKITGFGGFVNSPQFAYNHMTTDEIKKVWGKNSDLGCNIMRIYIPIGEDTWSQCLETAKLAKSLGLTLFASPWSMPAEWKTYNTVNATYTDANGVQQTTSLKEENYADYANYLNDFVLYMRNNGVELDAISIQNEPDEKASYAGCIWTPTQIANFLTNYRSYIDCKVIAPESVGMSDNYSSAMLADDVLSQFDIYAGHQYGALQSGFKQLQAKGKEAWMTEYLINWNANTTTTRDFSWATDAFSFVNGINTALQANVNAWIHYASKRFYGMLGDGQYGTTAGAITKRGYILSQFAKYTTGTMRIENVWSDATNKLSGSSYLSVTGDSVIVMIVNPSGDNYNVTVDLPFYSTSGKMIKTTETLNASSSSISLGTETCRPKVSIDASSITTLIFTKSSERPASQMTGQILHYSKIDNQAVTNTAFGTGYQLSGKTVTFDNSHYLISFNKTNGNGYLKLDDNYNQLVLHINSITSALNYTSSNTTLYYINNSGAVSSHNYGTINYNQNGNYDWILDISRSVLTDGCAGILGISNSNYSSVLTITFGDVYFRMGNEKGFKFTGVYSKGDSNELDCLEDAYYTSLDYTGTTGITSAQDWNAFAANKNCIYYVGGDVANNNTNVIAGTTCGKLSLSDTAGDFYAPKNFTATAASYSRTFDGYGIMTLPFEAIIPANVKAYTLQYSTTEVACKMIANNKIPANTPVLIKGTGTFTFEGTGSVSTPHALKVNDMTGVYIAVKAPAGSFSLKTVNGVTAFYKVTSGTEPTINPFGAYLMPSQIVTASSLSLKLDETAAAVEVIKMDSVMDNTIYDIWGRRVNEPKRGVVYIRGGKKIVIY
ncbi:hypothetical protein [Parabacteroides sp. FAFU027]|uniref:hypothetical protein n=1 Tax=Parabacteroides sp. FAFU027 TaxID=2922715 RepID=UPI001FAF5EE4|nr:hypothetical protein [Parabacteroides sp. FAFU027]